MHNLVIKPTLILYLNSTLKNSIYMLFLNLKVSETHVTYLKELCEQNDLVIKQPNILHQKKLNSSIDWNSLVTLIVGSTSFWITLRLIVQEISKKSDVHITIENEEYKLEINAKRTNIDKLIKSLKETVDLKKKEG